MVSSRGRALPAVFSALLLGILSSLQCYSALATDPHHEEVCMEDSAAACRRKLQSRALMQDEAGSRTALLQTRAELRASSLPGLLQATATATEDGIRSSSFAQLPSSSDSNEADSNVVESMLGSGQNGLVAALASLLIMAVFAGICSLLIYLCCCRKSHDHEEVFARALAGQVVALNQRNVKVSIRAEATSACPCCTSCCVLISVPIIFVGIFTVVPNIIMKATQLDLDVITVHPTEYGRNFTSTDIWKGDGRQLEDYLFEPPLLSRARGLPGYPSLWHSQWSKEAPKGACYCKTLAVIGPRSEDLKSYLERKYSAWQDDWKARGSGGSSGVRSITDLALQERECPGRSKKTFFKTFASEANLSDAIRALDYSSVNTSRGSPGVPDRICGAIVLHDDWQTASRPEITIRTNITGADITGSIGTKRIDVKPRGIIKQSEGFFWYLSSGFLAMQSFAEDFVVEQRVGSQKGYGSYLDFVPLPTEPFTTNRFTEALGGMFGSAATPTLMYAAMVMNIASVMIRERNTKQKELMRLMGLYDSALTLSWTLLFGFCNLLSSWVCAVLILNSWVHNSSLLVLTLIIFFCSMCTVFIGMIVSTFVSGERLGALVAVGLYNMMGLAWLFLTVSSDDGGGSQGFGGDLASTVTGRQLYGFSLVPQVCFALCLKTYMNMDSAGVGVNIYTMFSTFEKYSVGWGLCMLCLDFFLYGLLYMYLEQVMPQDVGLAKPWYFPLAPATWRELLGLSPPEESHTSRHQHQHQPQPQDSLSGSPSPSSGGDDNDKGELFEEEDEEHLQHLRSRNQVIQVRGLRVTFKNAAGGIVKAVDGLNLTLYHGECFCLLGHNGAGKSTTMAVLTGMLPPTAGDVRVLGHRLPEERNLVRRKMGFCMQHNVLWDTLTVEEHVHLFGALIGLPPEVTAASCDRVLEKVDLLHKRNAAAASLSGGMKRKLNVALALLGDSKVLFLDEPSAGMDPHTRRQLWEMLKQLRNDRIVCLTTHYMDEADELGDRISIMVSGRAACRGTNSFLKQKLGCGYMLNFVKHAESTPSKQILDVVERHCGHDVAQASTVGRELRVRIPFQGSEAFPTLMKELDQNLAKLGLESYGVGVSDLEDVFLKVASGHEVQAEAITRTNSDPDVHGGEALGLGDAVERKRPSFAQQFSGLYLRRVRYASRDSRTFFCQLFLPILYMTLFIFLAKHSISSNLAAEFSKVTLDSGGWNAPTSSAHGPTEVSVAADPTCSFCKTMTQSWSGMDNLVHELSVNISESRPTQPYMDSLAVKKINTNGVSATRRSELLSEWAFEDTALSVAHSANTPPQFGGFYYSDRGVTVFPNTTAYYSAPALLNMHYSALINTQSQEGKPRLKQITLKSQPLERTSFEQLFDNTVSSTMLGVIIRIAHAFIPAGVAGYIAMEYEMQVRHQLRVSGASSSAYWTSNLVFDLTFGIFSMIGTLCVFWVMDADQWLSFPNFYATISLLLLFIPSMALSTYFYSNFCSTSGGAMALILVGHLIIGSAGLDIARILALFPKTRWIGNLVLWLLRFLFPTVCLDNGFGRLAIAHSFRDFVHLSPFAGIIFGNAYYMDRFSDLPPMTAAGDDVAMLIFDIFAFAILLAWQDRGGFDGFSLGDRRCPESMLSHDEEEAVKKEKERVQHVDPANEVLVVKDVHKTYNGTDFAVRGISYAVEPGQIFGLLGVNGAGKTTTFKMMCGELLPSAGTITVGGKDVRHQRSEVWKLIGYCPQFNALLDLLTVREHLDLYGRVKGLTGKALESDIREKIRTFDLGRFQHTRASQLSGGNMRKLSCAIAMVGEPPIVFLDEPSAGMDPVARRFMWDVIQGIGSKRQGSAVVLTTHSMEEADALCTRIAIQASGQVKCLGTPQQLKERHGGGLELNVRFAVPSSAEVKKLCQQWRGAPQDLVEHDTAIQLAQNRLKSSYEVAKHGAKSLFGGDRNDHVLLGALAEWCLNQEQIDAVEKFLRETCLGGGPTSEVSCMQRSGRSLSYCLKGQEADGSALSYGRLFGLLQAHRERLNFADFQLSQGTLERTFNRLASEDRQASAE